MLSPVLPATVNQGLCAAASICFLVSCGKAPSTGCAKITSALPRPLLKKPLLLYWFESSSKLCGTSLGKVFFGLISFLTCAGFGGTSGATGGLAASGGLTTGFRGGAVFSAAGGVGLAGDADCCITVAAGFCSALAFRKR